MASVVSIHDVLCAVLRGDCERPSAGHDLPSLITTARTNRVHHLVAWHAGQGTGLDDWFGVAAEDVRAEVRGDAVIEEVRRQELQEVMALLKAVPGAEPILLKGAALAYTAYAEPWLRPRLDTDILISREAVSACLDALQRVGYRQEIAASGTLVISQASLDRTDEFGITHVLDLHWQIANRTVIARVLSHREIASRAVPAPRLGPDARVPCEADALLIACLHRAAHHRDSEELLWLYDIHLLAGKLSRAGWDGFAEAAERGNVRAICARGLSLATNLFRTPIPADVTMRLASSGREVSAIFLSKDVRLVDWLWADLRGLPWHRRGRLLVEHIVPSAGYIRERYGVQSRGGLVLAYMKRALIGVPKWFVAGKRR